MVNNYDKSYKPHKKLHILYIYMFLKFRAAIVVVTERIIWQSSTHVFKNYKNET